MTKGVMMTDEQLNEAVLTGLRDMGKKLDTHIGDMGKKFEQQAKDRGEHMQFTQKISGNYDTLVQKVQSHFELLSLRVDGAEKGIQSAKTMAGNVATKATEAVEEVWKMIIKGCVCIFLAVACGVGAVMAAKVFWIKVISKLFA